jgi:quercetin dioxygenase-like cupin family protein
MPEIATVDETTDDTHVELFEAEPRTVQLRLAADQRIPAHTHPGTDVVLYLVSGRLDLTLDGESYELTPGELVRFSGEREISPRAVEPSTALVVFAQAVDE